MPGVLYRKERELLTFLSQFQKQYGYSPTLKEMAGATGHSSVSTVHTIVRNLVDKGYLKKDEGNTRTLRILNEEFAVGDASVVRSIELPLMGYIAAGQPLEPHTDPNATFHISASMISGNKTAYVLQVKGESMIDDGILDGDFVVIERVADATNGQIVVALVDDNLATLKRFYRESGRIILKPANAKMDPIYPNSCKIQGKVVGLVRKFM